MTRKSAEMVTGSVDEKCTYMYNEMMSQGHGRHLLGLLTAGVICGAQTRSFTALLKGGAISHDTIRTVFFSDRDPGLLTPCVLVYTFGVASTISACEKVIFGLLLEKDFWRLVQTRAALPGDATSGRGLSTSGRRAAKPGATPSISPAAVERSHPAPRLTGQACSFAHEALECVMKT